MEYQPETFTSISISQLIRIEKWLYEYRSTEFRGLGEGFISKEEKPKYEDIQKKIKDVEEAILIRISDMQKRSFGGDINEA